jgi:hypothetical protein
MVQIVKSRVPWSFQLTDKQVKEYSIENIFGVTKTDAQTESDWFLSDTNKVI